MKTLMTGAAALLMLSLSAHAAQEVGPTDPQISKIMLNTNTAEIEMAKLAQKKSTNPEVKQFAGHMLKDHGDNMKKTEDLAEKIKGTPQDSPKSAELKMNAQDDLSRLKGLKGKEFDKAYIGSQVSMHQQVLEELERNLIPSADRPELKAHLEQTRDKIQGHLKHAQEIQRSL